MSLFRQLFAGGRIERLRKESVELSDAIGRQPSQEEMTPLERVLEELCELGYWPAQKSLANLCGKRIWVALDWGESDVESASQATRSGIMEFAKSGLLHLSLFCLGEGQKMDQETWADVERYRQEFERYIELVMHA